MSDQGMKVHLACDGLNRTGQAAPASHDRNRKTGKVLPVEKEGAGVYNLGGRTNGKGCQKWEDGKRKRDDVHTEDRCNENGQSGAEAEAAILSLNAKHRAQIIDLVRFLSASSDAQQKERYLNQLLKEI